MTKGLKKVLALTLTVVLMLGTAVPATAATPCPTQGKVPQEQEQVEFQKIGDGVKNKKATKIDKKAFKGINTKKVTIQFSKKMSEKTFKTMKARLKKAGFKGKIKK